MNLKKKIGLGTVQFGLNYGISNKNGKTTRQEVENILRFAKKNNIDLLDTAIAYGESEKVLGLVGVKSFKVISKFLPMDESNLTITQQLQNSLYSLKTSSLYAYLAHQPKDILKSPAQWKELADLKESGKIGKIGFSLNEPEVLEEILKRKIILDIIQVPYNYFDRRFEELMKMLHEQGCEIHSRSTFLQGLFFKKPETLPSYFNLAKKALHEVRNSTNYLAGSLLRFVLEKKFIDKVIVGVETKLQLEENIKSLNSCKILPNSAHDIPGSILIPSNWP